MAKSPRSTHQREIRQTQTDRQLRPQIGHSVVSAEIMFLQLGHRRRLMTGLARGGAPDILPRTGIPSTAEQGFLTLWRNCNLRVTIWMVIAAPRIDAAT